MSERTFVLNKLIKDDVLVAMKRANQKVDMLRLSDDHIETALLKKVLEEAREVDAAKTPDEEAVEMEDYMHVARAIDKVQAGIFDDLGPFNERIFARTVTLEASDKWVEYYANQPDRFPELKQVTEAK